MNNSSPSISFPLTFLLLSPPLSLFLLLSFSKNSHSLSVLRYQDSVSPIHFHNSSSFHPIPSKFSLLVILFSFLYPVRQSVFVLFLLSFSLSLLFSRITISFVLHGSLSLSSLRTVNSLLPTLPLP